MCIVVFVLVLLAFLIGRGIYVYLKLILYHITCDDGMPLH